MTDNKIKIVFVGHVDHGKATPLKVKNWTFLS